jgi:hypothetical protein
VTLRRAPVAIPVTQVASNTVVRNLPRGVKALAGALLIIGLLVVVALAARGSHPGGHARVAQRHVSNQVNDDLLTVIIILYFLGIVALVVLFIVSKRKWEAVQSHWLRDYVMAMLLFGLLAVVGYRIFKIDAIRHALRRGQPDMQAQARQARARRQHAAKLKRVQSGAHFDTTLAVGLLGLLVVGGAVYYVRIRSRATPLGDVPTSQVKEELATAVSDAIDDLRAEPDARAAVVAAYARMERSLGRHGWGRRPAETPFEYLARILTVLDVREDAVRELTELFEHAKFSPHPVDDLMKTRAIAALVGVREDLREPEAAAA